MKYQILTLKVQPWEKENQSLDTLEKVKADIMQLVIGYYLVRLSFMFWPLTLDVQACLMLCESSCQ